MDHLELVQGRLKGAGMTVNPDKIMFARSEISFLDHLISHTGVTVDPVRTQEIRDLPPPKNDKGVARFVGMITFYRWFRG